jgi:hypothetical protein
MALDHRVVVDLQVRLVPAQLARPAPLPGDGVPEDLDRLVRADDGGDAPAAGQRALREGPRVVRPGLDRDQVGAHVAGCDQVSPVEPPPHLTAEPARLEVGGAGAVVGEHVDHGVAAREREERVQVGRPEGTDAVARGEHGASLRCAGPTRD